ncbi:hypothetical protein J6TS1_12680 [Siminovitchia terrae]|uniref:Uncharacterized protein n=1 Tax=Siminovitchia terrae TaxID=1914933 RepID=A0ABQ4KTN6_SIMTE|nr:hypothetical protein [Siminovitchia terrae]GIN95398.1 hypothetical protein J6TS1_12680 [Siminovitchia terrae]
MNAYWYSIQWGFKPRLNKVKASGGCHRFSEEFIDRSSIKSGRKYAKAHLIVIELFVVNDLPPKV